MISSKSACHFFCFLFVVFLVFGQLQTQLPSMKFSKQAAHKNNNNKKSVYVVPSLETLTIAERNMPYTMVLYNFTGDVLSMGGLCMYATMLAAQHNAA